MATVNKDFRVKHGLVVEGTTATVNGSTVLTEASTEFLQDTSAAVLTGGSHSGISFSYNDTTGVVNATVSSTPTFTTSITFEGVTADDFETILQVVDPTADRTITLPDATGTVALTSDIPTTEAIEDIVGAMVSGNTESGITVEYDDASGKINFTVATLDTEAVQDIVGAMLSSNTETGITVTYEDADGTVDFAIDDEYIQDLIGAMVSSNSESGITVTYDDTNGKLDFSVATQLSTEDVQDIVGAMVSSNSESGIAVTYDDTNGKLDFDVADFTITLGGDLSGSATITNLGNATLTATIAADSVALGTDTTGDYVATIAGTTNQITVSGAGTEGRAATLSFPSAVTFPGTVTLNADPTDALHAATKQYVDSVAEGLHVHASVRAATTANINLSTDLENGDVVDGVTLATGNRVLVKSQTTKSQNGIYVVQASGAAVRATDYDTAGEIDAGDFVFVTEGTLYADTGWVQLNAITTLGTDEIEWSQFSGAGTYVAGNGLTLTGNSFSINTGVTVDLSTAQTLTNKTLTSPTISGLYLSDNNIIIEGTADVHETTLTFTDPTGDRTITFPDATGTVALLGSIALGTDTTGNYVATVSTSSGISGGAAGSEGTAISLALDINGLTAETSPADADTVAIYDSSVSANRKVALSNLATYILDEATGDVTFSNGVASIAANSVALGTDTTGDYVASLVAGTGVTLTNNSGEGATPTIAIGQAIGTAATPTFASLTLTSDTALTMANSSIADKTFTTSGTSAQVVDSWSATTFTSAKYVVQMKLGNDVEVIELLVTVDGNNNVYLTEYADVYSNAALGTTDAVYNGGNVELQVTPATTATVVKVHRVLIEA